MKKLPNFAAAGLALLAATLAGASGAQNTLPDRPGTPIAEAPVNPLLSDRVPTAVKVAAAKSAPTSSQKKAATKPPVAKAAAKKPVPKKKPAPRKTARKKKTTPLNAAHTRGLYTVDKQGSGGVYYRKGFVLGVGINVIEANLSDPEVRVGAMVSRGGIGTAESFGAMVRHAQPTAAITGTFFGIKNRIPTGDLVINGKALFRGFIGTAVAITEGNVVSFIPTRYKDTSIDWSPFDTVIRGGPRLVWGGKVAMTAYSEGFRALPVKARRTRTAVGLTRDNRLQFVAVREGITLWELAKVMRAIGAYHAVALDGGTSTAMYYAGNYIANPGRSLTNVLMIYHRKAQFDAMRDRFGAPYEPRATAAAPPPTVLVQPPTPEPEIEGHGFEPAKSLHFPVTVGEMVMDANVGARPGGPAPSPASP